MALRGTNMGRFAVVFAGGGCRAFWALGAFECLRHALPPVDEWAGVSAGSAMALGAALDRADTVIDEFCTRTRSNPNNFRWSRLIRGQRPFPHEEIYRSTVSTALGENAVDDLRNVAPVRILVAEVEGPYRLFRVYSAMRAYQRRRKQGGLHGPAGVARGIHEVVVTAQDLSSNQQITDAVLASSSSPPITRTQAGTLGLFYDGSLVDNVPVRALQIVTQKGNSGDKTLVLLNRPMESLPASGAVLYLAPSASVPAQKWDYTSPEKIRATVEQGRTEVAHRMSEIYAWLGG